MPKTWINNVSIDKQNRPENSKKLYQTIWIYNLELDLDSYVLAAAHDWVVEFANYCEELIVVSTHCGRIQLPNNVRVLEIGGGSYYKRIKALVKLIKVLPIVWRKRKNSIAFHHMSPKTVIILGWYYKAIQVPQGLWYSHSQGGAQYRVARRIVDFIFTPSLGTAPGNSQKNCYVGHGISSMRFRYFSSEPKRITNLLGSVGRISEIKNYHGLIKVVKNNDLTLNRVGLRVEIVGPPGKDYSYIKSLIDSTQDLSTPVKFSSPINYDEIPSFMNKLDLFYSGMPQSVDKAAVEAGLSGCLIVSENKAVLELSGMYRAWSLVLGLLPLDLENQIVTLSGLSDTRKEEMRKIVSIESAKNGSLEGTVSRIIGKFIQENETH